MMGGLSGLPMDGVLVAETAVLFGLQPVGMVFLFFGDGIIPLLAVHTGQSNPGSHQIHLFARVIVLLGRDTKKIDLGRPSIISL